MNTPSKATATKKDNLTIEPAKVYIAISDQDIGISPKMLPYLFNKFITDADYETGLGLYIAKILVEIHSGKIRVYNNKDGIGSTFVFSLPKYDDNSENKTIY